MTTPDPLLQIEEELTEYGRLCALVPNAGTQWRRIEADAWNKREALLSLIRSAIAAQPGQGEPSPRICTPRCPTKVRPCPCFPFGDDCYKPDPARLPATPPTPTPDAELVARTVKRCSDAYDGWVDELAERLFWEFDKRSKQTGMPRDAFKSAIRQALGAYESMIDIDTPAPDEAGVRERFEALMLKHGYSESELERDTEWYRSNSLDIAWIAYRAALLGEPK